jgi:hypothetical protein
MKRRPLSMRRIVRAASLVGMVAVLAPALVSAAPETATPDRLSVDVVATNRGPLPACSGPDCTPTNAVGHFVYIDNKNQLTNLGGRTRENVPNAFVINSVESTISVDGVDTFHSTMTPPPNSGDFSFWAGHWPSTVSCPPGGPPPCGVVGNPAILPGENTVAVYTGWTHAVGEPNGKYVFRYTVHGALNGTPVDLEASSKAILMTD